MTENQLGLILKNLYEEAPKGEQVAHIHLFGIQYAPIIHSNNYKMADILRASGLNQSYVTEISKGIKLAKYVVIKGT